MRLNYWANYRTRELPSTDLTDNLIIVPHHSPQSLIPNKEGKDAADWLWAGNLYSAALEEHDLEV